MKTRGEKNQGPPKWTPVGPSPVDLLHRRDANQPR